MVMEKSLENTSIEDVKKTTSDVVVFGNGDTFQLISKASSKSQGWNEGTEESAFWRYVLEEWVEYNPIDGKHRWKKIKTDKTTIGGIVGSQKENEYNNIKFKGRQIHGHRLAFLQEEGYLPKLVDHINRVKSDNRWENLREATYSLNAQNTETRSTNSSGARGVHYDTKKEKWTATIKLQNKSIWLGYHENLEEAVAARFKAETNCGYNKVLSKQTTAIKALEIPNVGCVVQVTTEFRNKDGGVSNCAEALTFVPNVEIALNSKGDKYLTQI